MSKLLFFPNIKQPWEEYYLGFDFSSVAENSSIETATVSATLNGEDITSDLLDVLKQTIIDRTVYFWVKNCLPGFYKITCQIVLLDESKHEINAMLKVLAF